jgi:tetratricopeptide (TPR) repeat protein
MIDDLKIGSNFCHMEGKIPEYYSLLKVNSNVSDSIFEIAEAKQLNEDYVGAIHDYKGIIELCNNENIKFEEDKISIQKEAYSLRAWCKERQLDYNGAISDYSQAIQLDSENYNAYCDRGLVKLIIKDYSGATNDFEAALKIDADYYKAFFYRGRLKHELHDYAGAIFDFNKAIKLYPKDDKPHSICYFRGIAKSKFESERS